MASGCTWNKNVEWYTLDLRRISFGDSLLVIRLFKSCTFSFYFSERLETPLMDWITVSLILNEMGSVFRSCVTFSWKIEPLANVTFVLVETNKWESNLGSPSTNIERMSLKRSDWEGLDLSSDIDERVEVYVSTAIWDRVETRNLMAYTGYIVDHTATLGHKGHTVVLYMGWLPNRSEKCTNCFAIRTGMPLFLMRPPSSFERDAIVLYSQRYVAEINTKEKTWKRSNVLVVAL